MNHNYTHVLRDDDDGVVDGDYLASRRGVEPPT